MSREGKEMKYLALWEMKPKDMGAVIKKYQELLAAREKNLRNTPHSQYLTTMPLQVNTRDS